MQVRRRTNFLLGLLWLAVALLVGAQALGWLPASAFDIAARAWPVVLVLAGLVLLLRGRVPLAGGIALILCIGLVAGVTALAYNNRAESYREDRREVIEQAVAGVGLLRVRVEVLATDVELRTAVQGGVVSGEFIGSSESEIALNYETLDDGSATLTLLETRANPLPMLESLGRGRLRLELPAGLPLDVAFIGARGNITLNLGGTQLERLNVDLARGDALISLPDYDPVLSGETDSLGTFSVAEGNLTVVVPLTIAARLSIESGSDPEYDATEYNLLVGGVLEARGIDTAERVVNYAVRVPAGRVRLEIPDA